MNGSLPGSSVHRILQARILEWGGCHALLQGIFPTLGLHLGPLHCRQILYHLSQQEINIYHGTNLEKAMGPHSSTLAWKILWAEEPGRLQCMGSLRVRHDWATSLSLFTFMHWRRKWQPTPVFSPGESQGQGSLVGCRLWGCMKVKSESEVAQSCLTLSDPMDCSLQGSSIQGIYQARVLVIYLIHRQ